MSLTMLREAPAEAAFATCPSCNATLTFPPTTGWTVRSPQDVYSHLPHLATLEREELHVVLLTTKNRVMDVVRVYQGNVSASLVRVSEVFTEAVRKNATSIILVHNHPSGDPTPSPDDLHLTAEVLAASRILDIDLLDHVVIGRDGYASLRDRGVDFARRAPVVS